MHASIAIVSLACFYRKNSRVKFIATAMIIQTEITGEGESYCFISNPEAVLYFFVAPIALTMLFNAFALVRTVLHIVKTRKVSLSY